MRLKTLLAVAAIAASAGHDYSMNTAYTQQRDKQRAERDNALTKKQRVREQIRARRKALK